MQKENFMIILVGGYLLLAAALVYLSAELGELVDLLDKKTTLASAFIGGVLLAAVTSLPEMFTSITSVVSLGKPALVIGNILGSNLFNVGALGLVCLLFLKGLQSSTVTASHKTTLTCTLLAYLTLSAALLVGNGVYVCGVSLVSVLIFGLYIWSIRTMSNDTDTAGSADTSNLTLKQVVIRFVLFAVLLVVTSIVITFMSDLLSEQLGWGATYAGAVLLGIVTSLPELISCIVLARRGNFNALFGNIAGSNMFNFAILLLADVVYLHGPIYGSDEQSMMLIVLGLISCVAVLGQLVTLVRTNSCTQKRSTMVLMGMSMVPILSYLTFVVQGA